jgi:hypothetical protein
MSATPTVGPTLTWTASPTDTASATASATVTVAPTFTETPSPIPPSATATETSVPTPTATSTSLQVGASGYGQSGTQVGYGFVAVNATNGQALENSTYVVTAYDSTGAAIAAANGQILILLPGQRLGIGGTLDLAPGLTVARIAVQLTPGRSEVAQSLPGFTAQQVTWQRSGSGFTATGTIVSPYYQDATQVQVSALAYDASGTIVGGGSTVVDVVPARGQKTVLVPFVTSSSPDRVELYATITTATSFR